MGAFEDQPCVGLFGACGPTTHRQDLFIPAYEQVGIRYYNPQVPEGTWAPDMMPDEADHLKHDVVQTWPVTPDTYALGTLAEQGYSFAESLRSESPFPKFIIPMITLDLADHLDNPELRAETTRARLLALGRLQASTSPNVFVVDSLEEMLEVSIVLYGVAKQIVELTRSKNVAYRRFVGTRDRLAALETAMASGLLGPGAAKLRRDK
jgi:hypothetical protein